MAAVMGDVERLARLEDAIDHLRVHAAGAAVLVEGRKDVRALERLGVGGKHLTVHRGRTLEHRIDGIVERAQAEGWRRLILLVDWDRTGGRLMERLRQGLEARLPLDTDCRRRVATASHTRCIEDVPDDLAALRARVGARERMW